MQSMKIATSIKRAKSSSSEPNIEQSSASKKTPQTPKDAITKTTEAMRLESIRVAQELLAIQQSETQQSKIHSNLLSSELTTLIQTTEQKQRQINQLNEVIIKRDMNISTLNDEIKKLRIGHGAFKELEETNSQLHDKLRQKNLLIEELSMELQLLKEDREDKLLHTEHSAIKMAEQDYIISNQVANLSEQLHTAEQLFTQKSELIDELNSELNKVKAELHWKEEVRRDQLSRSRQTEYRTLAKLDSTAEQLQVTADERELALEALDVTKVRSEMLQRQLNDSIEKMNQNQEAFEHVIAVVERSNLESSMNEKLLLTQIADLSQKLELSQLTLQQLVKQVNAELKPTPLIQSIRMLEQQQRSQIMTAELIEEEVKIKAGSRLLINCKTKQQRSASDYFTGYDDNHTRSLSKTTGNLSPLRQHYHAAPASSLNVTAGAVLEPSAFGSIENEGLQEVDASRSLLLPERDSVVEDRMLQRQTDLKQALLTKYLKVLGFNYCSSQTIVSRQKHFWNSSVLDLHRLSLIDDDLNHIVEWLRIMTLQRVQCVDLGGNCLTEQGVLKLLAWLVAMSPDDLLGRTTHLTLDLRHNRVGTDGHVMQRFVDFIRATRHECFHLVLVDSNAPQVVLIYGSARIRPGASVSDTEEHPARLLVRIDLRESRLG